MAHQEMHHGNPDLANLPPGTFCFFYDIRTRKGTGDQFMREFHAWDHSGQNPVHKTPGLVREGILYRSQSDPDRFLLIGYWNDKVNHQRVVARVREMRPRWMEYMETPLVPEYFEIVG